MQHTQSKTPNILKIKSPTRHSFYEKTARSPDSIHLEMLKHLLLQHIDIIVYLFQTTWNFRKLLTPWKQVHIIPTNPKARQNSY